MTYESNTQIIQKKGVKMNNKIMVRLRGSRPSYRTLFEGDDMPNLGLVTPTGVEYAAEYDPTSGPETTHDMYYVELDQEQIEKMVDPYIDAINMGVEAISQPEYNAVNVVYKVNGRRLFLSRVNAGARIGEDGRTMLQFHEKHVEVEKVSFAVEFSGDVDAYYDGQDRIYFSKFSKAKGLFKDFDEFYQEAYYDDNELFLGNDLFDVGEITTDDISPAETKVIAEIRGNHNLDLEKPEIADKIRNYVRSYPLSGVKINKDGKLKITTKDDLKCVTKLLTQRYYTSDITGEVLEARGSTKMTDQKAKKVFNGVEQMTADNK